MEVAHLLSYGSQRLFSGAEKSGLTNAEIQSSNQS